jgi:hypothetical protein
MQKTLESLTYIGGMLKEAGKIIACGLYAFPTLQRISYEESQKERGNIPYYESIKGPSNFKRGAFFSSSITFATTVLALGKIPNFRDVSETTGYALLALPFVTNTISLLYESRRLKRNQDLALSHHIRKSDESRKSNKRIVEEKLKRKERDNQKKLEGIKNESCNPLLQMGGLMFRSVIENDALLLSKYREFREENPDK